MLVIRTAEALARALDSPHDLELKQLLRSHADRLTEYPDYEFHELAEFFIIEAGETLEGLCSASGLPLLDSDSHQLAVLPEIALRHTRWFELVLILSDDGFGVVLLIEVAENTDTVLLNLCEHYVSQHADHG